MEADVVKTDGEYIYVISGDKLYIVSAEDGMLDTVSETDFFNEKAYYEEASGGKADRLLRCVRPCLSRGHGMQSGYVFKRRPRYYYI